MDRNFRKKTLIRLAKDAGIISRLVEQNLKHPELVMSTTKESVKPVFQSIGSVGPGTSVMMPQNPVKSDSSVDIIIQIRGIPGGDTKVANQLGKNAIIITCEAGGVGSKENYAAFGNPTFVNKSVGTVLANLKKRYPDKDIHLGKLTISSFSGGGSATAQLLANRNQLPKGQLPPKFVFIDGLHSEPGSPAMKAVVDYARQVQKDPSTGELSIVHSAVVPGGYSSTTQTADHILSQLGIQRQPTQDSGKELSPKSIAESGGLKVIQLYDKQAPYKSRDPKSGEVKPNVPGTSGWQHIQSLKFGLQNAL